MKGKEMRSNNKWFCSVLSGLILSGLFQFGLSIVWSNSSWADEPKPRYLTEDEIYEQGYQVLLRAARDLGVDPPPRTPKKPAQEMSPEDIELFKEIQREAMYLPAPSAIRGTPAEGEWADGISERSLPFDFEGRVAKRDRVRQLIRKGAKIDAVDPDGVTRSWEHLIHMVAQHASLRHDILGGGDVLLVLLEEGVDVDKLDSMGETALLKVVKTTFPDVPWVVEQLLLHGADSTIKDHYGRTALDIINNHLLAESILHPSIVASLKRSKALLELYSKLPKEDRELKRRLLAEKRAMRLQQIANGTVPHAGVESQGNHR